MSNLTQRFTLFKSSGAPLRAILTVTFTEHVDVLEDKKKTDPELTARRVRLGDSISSIAAEVYQDPSLWRLIAESNGLDDPRNLKIGTLLSIPDVE